MPKRKLSERKSPGAQSGKTVEALIGYCAKELEKANVFFGHGCDNSRDEAAELVFFACGLRHEDALEVYAREPTTAQRSAVVALLKRRIEERVPTAYLTHRMWFCGYEFYVDDRVLVPRSPLAELIETQFAPWIDPPSIRTMLDIGTGSGCIAIASALALPDAQVDATDISADALAVTHLNIERFSLHGRVHARQSDVFSNLQSSHYDVIVSNPPYVSRAEVLALPQEYQREPQLGLLAGDDGLSVVRRILAEAEQHLNPGGILIVEVGDSEETVLRNYPRVPFTWLEFERGGGGVFVLSVEQLAEHRTDLLGARDSPSING